MTPLKPLRTLWTLSIALISLLLFGCGGEDKPKKLTIGVSFETLQTEFWVAAMDAFKASAAGKDIVILEAVADGDANRQLDQIRTFMTRGVDGIIVVPKDAHTILPAIQMANKAGIPLVCFNRPPADGPERCATVVADNFLITRATVEHMIQLVRQDGRQRKALLLIGDLGDINAIGRRDGFEETVAKHPDLIQVVARIPTEWNQEKAQAGVVNALQAHPDIDFIFSSSDFLLPSIVSALKSQGRYVAAGQPGHVLLGSFDGDATAYRMLREGYLDADGVQDVYFEVDASIQAILDLRAGRDVPKRIIDPGFVIHGGNLDEMAPRMWGSKR